MKKTKTMKLKTAAMQAMLLLMATTALQGRAATAEQDQLTIKEGDRLTVEQFKLSNGMTVWLNNDPTQPKVFGAVVVKAGSRDCPNSGIAHYLEHLLFKGTKEIGTIDYEKERPWLDSITGQYDRLAHTTDAAARLRIQRHINELSIKAAQYAIPNEYSNLISRYGGTQLNAYTSFEETVFHNYFTPQYLQQWCELNAGRLLDPVFRLFQGELEAVYEEKNMYADNLLTSTAEKVQQYALKGTPYAYPILGATDSLKNPRLSEMYRFFKTYYVPENMGLILCGDLRLSNDTTDSHLTMSQLRALLERTFGQLPPSDHPIVKAPRTTLRDFRHTDAFRVKVPVPLVKASGYLWQAPSERDSDYLAFQVMVPLLSNPSKTGLIDSLMTTGKLFYALGIDHGYNFKDFGAYGFGLVPRLPFGSRKKAERLCLAQVDKLKRGAFSDRQLATEKLTLQRNMMLNLETIGGRSTAMINAFSHDLQWTDITRRYQAIAKVTKADIMRVARRWLGDDSLKIIKRFGRYPKEHVSQPGYKPVTPPHAGEQSAYAKTMMQEPVAPLTPKTVDFDRDATTIALAPLVNLYTTSNPMNDVYTLKLIYRIGERNDPRLSVLADYLNRIGTRQHDHHAFAQLLRQYGTTLSASSSPTSFTITLTGLEPYLDNALTLLHEWLTQPKADHRQLKRLAKTIRLNRYTLLKNNAEIANAVMEYAAKRQNSSYLTQLPAKAISRERDDSLLQLFTKVQTYQTDIAYCGHQSADALATLLRQHLPLQRVSHPWQPVTTELQNYDDHVIYLYDNPSARQTIVGAYQPIAAQPDIDRRARLTLWGNYFGGGMQSVLFQEVREFRALAYSAHGTTLKPDLKTRGADRCGFYAKIGTQADKAMQTVTLLDSLLDHMPERPNNLEAARQMVVNGINNSYPTFRNLPVYVANERLLGYDHDPDTDLLSAIDTLGIDDAMTFYRSNVQQRPRALIIVGNKRLLNLDALRRMGRVVELKAKDICK